MKKIIFTAIAILINVVATPQSFHLENLKGFGQIKSGTNECMTHWLLKSLSVTETDNGYEVMLDDGIVMESMYEEEEDRYNSSKTTGLFTKLTPKELGKYDWSVHYKYVPAGCEGRLVYMIIVSQRTWKSEKYPERNKTEIELHIMSIAEHSSRSAWFTLTPEEWESAQK